MLILSRDTYPHEDGEHWRVTRYDRLAVEPTVQWNGEKWSPSGHTEFRSAEEALAAYCGVHGKRYGLPYGHVGEYEIVEAR